MIPLLALPPTNPERMPCIHVAHERELTQLTCGVDHHKVNVGGKPRDADAERSMMTVSEFVDLTDVPQDLPPRLGC